MLIARVAEIQPAIATVSGALTTHSAQEATLSAINSLRHGAWTDAAMLGTSDAAEEAADRNRTLVRLVDELPHARPPRHRDRDVD